MCIRDSVEEPVAGLQGEFAADQVELVVLGPLQGGAGGPVGAGVHHGGPEDPLVEVVADVVVVADGPPVAAPGVPGAAAPGRLLRGRRGRRPRSGQGDEVPYGVPRVRVGQQRGGGRGGVRGGRDPPGQARAQRAQEGGGRGGGRGIPVPLPEQARHPVQQLEQVAVDGQVTGHPGPGQAELSGLPQHPAQGTAAPDDEDGAVGRPGHGSVPRADAHGQGAAQQGLGKSGQPRSGVGHGAPPQSSDPSLYPSAAPGTPKGPPAPRMAGGPFGVVHAAGSAAGLPTQGQEALAFSAGAAAAAGAGAGLAAS